MKKGFSIFILISFLIASFFLPVTVGFCEQAYHIKEMTPQVKEALESRRNRFDDLKKFKQQAVIGENNRGYVELLGSDPAAKAIVDAENKDRTFIYKTILEQNNLPGDAMSTIETVFAQVQRDKASTGDKIQQANGEWVTK